MPLYEHHDGKTITERVRTREGSPDDRRLSAALDRKGSGVRLVDEHKPRAERAES